MDSVLLECCGSRPVIAEWILDNCSLTKIGLDKAFKKACDDNNLRSAQLIHSKAQCIQDHHNAILFQAFSECKVILAMWLYDTFDYTSISTSDYLQVFHRACRAGNIQIVKLILERVQDVSIFVDCDKETCCVGAACRNGHLNIVQLLTDHLQSCQMYQDGFDAALLADHLRVAQWLFQKFSIRSVSKFDDICQNSHPDIVRWVSETFAIDIAVAQSGFNAAVKNDRYDTVAYLLDKYPQINVSDDMGESYLKAKQMQPRLSNLLSDLTRYDDISFHVVGDIKYITSTKSLSISLMKAWEFEYIMSM